MAQNKTQLYPGTFFYDNDNKSTKDVDQKGIEFLEEQPLFLKDNEVLDMIKDALAKRLNKRHNGAIHNNWEEVKPPKRNGRPQRRSFYKS
jgi:hypothetical protein